MKLWLHPCHCFHPNSAIMTRVYCTSYQKADNWAMVHFPASHDKGCSWLWCAKYSVVVISCFVSLCCLLNLIEDRTLERVHLEVHVEFCCFDALGTKEMYMLIYPDLSVQNYWCGSLGRSLYIDMLFIVISFQQFISVYN